MLRVSPVVHIRLPQRTCELLERSEVGVVAGSLTGDSRVEGMVEVVAPTRVEAEPMFAACSHHAGIVEVALGNHPSRPPEPNAKVVCGVGELLEEGSGGTVGEGMY